MGPRHAPMNSAFMNGTVKGDGVWIPMESILGGRTLALGLALARLPGLAPALYPGPSPNPNPNP